MRMRISILITLPASLLVVSAVAAETVDFARDVAPILREKCVSCHGPALRQGGLRVDSRVEILRGGKTGPALDESAPLDGLLFRKVSGDDAGMRMPPTGALPDKEIAALKAWVEQGAPWDPGAVFSSRHEVSDETRALFQTLRQGDLPALRAMLDKNPKLVQAVNEDGSTALTLAAHWAGPAELKELLSRGADPNIANDAGVTALIPATGDLESTKLLVEAGADVNRKTHDGQTPLLAAARRSGSAPVLAYLLEKGADLAAQDSSGASVLHQAAASGDLDALKLLLSRGAVTDAVSKAGRTPLLEAAFAGNPAAYRLLLDHKADLELGSASGPLRLAIFFGDREVVRSLLDRRDLKGSALNGAIYQACASYRADPQTVKLLLAAGADPTFRNRDGMTPLDAAQRLGYQEIEGALRDAIDRRSRGDQ